MNHDENCKYLLDSLSDYVDGSLGNELCAELERHMSGCDNCRIVVDTLRKTVSLYKVNSEPAEVPEDVRERLFFSLNLEEFLEPRSS
jgi:anti-sigma factor RsiW